MWNKMSPRLLFLIDGLGAVLSAALLGLVLARLEGIFGMPPPVLHGLALLAVVFAVYSFFCFGWLSRQVPPAHDAPPRDGRPQLKIIALANLTYAALTLGLVLYLYPQISLWGLVYFALELVVVVGLALVELAVSRSARP